MKALVGATCIAVIAFVGYFFWGEYSRSQARAQNYQAKVDRFIDEYCERISRFSARYDKNYTQSLGHDEVMKRYKQCNDFRLTGKLPY